MNKRAVVKRVLSSIVSFGVMSVVTLAGDLSRYRNFQFGMDLRAAATLAGENPEQAKVLHRRPALIQELSWRPQASGPSLQPNPGREVVFSFIDGRLFQIVVSYDRYGTEGLTAVDITKAISATYGLAPEVPVLAKPETGRYGELEESVAVWQDAQYRFDLIRSSYGPSFKLVGVVKRLDAVAREAALEAKRLDAIEAPQREAARIENESEAARVKLEKARLQNLPTFRP